jgi:hypothetical protein
MGYVTREPHIFGSVQPTAGELRELAYMDLDQNAYGSIFISNTNDTTPDKVRLAVKPLIDEDQPVSGKHYIIYDLFLDPSYSIQIANIGLDYGCRIYGYSQNGFVNFNMTGDLIRTIL